MKKVMLFTSLLFMVLASPAFAAGDPVQKELQGALDTFTTGCQHELVTYCKDVTPGEGRIIACLYAVQDKLSTRCIYALNDSVGQIDRSMTKLAFAVNECREELEGICGAVEPGEGRILACLQKNQSKVSKRCTTALKDAGYQK